MTTLPDRQVTREESLLHRISKENRLLVGLAHRKNSHYAMYRYDINMVNYDDGYDQIM